MQSALVVHVEPHTRTVHEGLTGKRTFCYFRSSAEGTRRRDCRSLSSMSTHTTLLEYVPHLRAELAAFVALWSQPNGGIDTEHGGFCCGLDYNGTRLVGNKYVWFNEYVGKR